MARTPKVTSNFYTREHNRPEPLPITADEAEALEGLHHDRAYGDKMDAALFKTWLEGHRPAEFSIPFRIDLCSEGDCNMLVDMAIGEREGDYAWCCMKEGCKRVWPALESHTASRPSCRYIGTSDDLPAALVAEVLEASVPVAVSRYLYRIADHITQTYQGVPVYEREDVVLWSARLYGRPWVGFTTPDGKSQFYLGDMLYPGV